MAEETELIRRYVEDRSQEAFAELVRRRINFVYAAALRQVGGDAHLADEVTQAVFLALARQAPELRDRPVLTGWLHTTTRFVAAKAVRTHRRWKNREMEANMMSTDRASPEPEWNDLSPVLDEVLQELDEPDRDAILLRYFDGQPYGKIGSTLGLHENSARMRVERALDKLKTRLERRGITSTAAALGIALANQPAVSAPIGLAVAVINAAPAGAVGTLAATTLIMSTAKIVTTAAAIAAAVGIGYYAGSQIAAPLPGTGGIPITRLEDQITRLRTENRDLDTELRRIRANLAASAPVPATREVQPLAPIAMSLIPEKLDGPPTLSVIAASIQNNLRQISAAANQWRKQRGVDPTLQDLVGPNSMIKSIRTVDSEDYSALDLSGNAPMKVTTESGLTASYDPVTNNVSVVSPETVAIAKARDAFRAANGRDATGFELAPYVDNPTVRQGFVAGTGQMNLAQELGSDFGPNLKTAANVYLAAYKAAYGVEPPQTMDAFRHMAGYIENETDRARFLEAWEKVNAEANQAGR